MTDKNLNLDLVSIKHIHNLVKFYLFVLKILSRKLMTEGQNDGMMNAKPKSNISKGALSEICFSIDNDKGR